MADKEVSDETLHALYDLMKMGPTSMNMSPARLVFVRTVEAKERLKPHLMGANVDKTMDAPVCVIIGHDLEFWRHMHRPSFATPPTCSKQAGCRGTQPFGMERRRAI